MKRYRVLAMTFDSRAVILGQEIRAEWTEEVRVSCLNNKARIRAGLQTQFGVGDWARKERDLIDVGPLPFSVVAFHNTFLRDAHSAFVLGAYYPALTAATCLGERILNHLVLRLRGDFIGSPAYNKLKLNRKQSIDD